MGSNGRPAQSNRTTNHRPRFGHRDHGSDRNVLRLSNGAAPNLKFDFLNRRGVAWIAALGLLAIASCQTPRTVDSERPALRFELETPNVPEPLLARDLADIRSSGTLRVLLRNSSSSYHILRGQEYGFEYELAARFARDLGVRLEVVLPDSQSSVQSQLNAGKIDLIAMPLEAPESGPRFVEYTAPYNEVQLVLVSHGAEADSLRGVQDLEGVMVAARHWSREESALLELRRAGLNVGIVMFGAGSNEEEILEYVADGTYPAAVVHSDVARAVQSYRPELEIAFELEESASVRWAVRKNSPGLLEAVDRFLLSHRRELADGSLRKSRLYNILSKKYFSDSRLIRSRVEDPFHLARTGRLSPYDEQFAEHAARYGFDWRLIASISFQESRFDPNAISWAGAVGLMQLMPKTAGRSKNALADPELNIELGVKHFAYLYRLYRFLDDDARLKFALAAYNCGQGHLDDARILCMNRGRDPNDWENVQEALLQLRQPEYHRQVRYGFVRGQETVRYVDRVLQRYELFKKILDETPLLKTAMNITAPTGAE